MDYKSIFSEDVAAFRSSPVREILKKVDISKLYYFSGGHPSPETFPLERLAALTEKVVAKYGAKVLQYGDTRGQVELREALARRFDIAADSILLTSSSQQGIDVCARILLDPGDVVLCENPSYLGALNSFRSYRAELVGMDLTPSFDASKKRKEQLERLLAAGKKIKFFYVIPDFQNPSGQTLSLAQRSELVSLAERYDFMIVEDSPYRELRYEGEGVTSIYSLCPERTIHLGSFSKIFAPGLRLGWMIAPQDILQAVFVCKQSLDLCPGVLNQYLALEFLESGELDKNLEKSLELYRGKRDLLLSLLEKYMPEGVEWTHPEGGLFLFVHLPENMDATALFPVAIEKGLAYVPGSYFYADDSHRNTMRLSFSYMENERMEPGIKLLAELLDENRKG